MSFFSNIISKVDSLTVAKKENLKNGPNSHIRLKTVDPNQLVMLVIFGTGLRHICLIAEESIAPEFET